MNYVVFALLLGACGANGVALRSNATLQDIRDFLNTTKTIYVYSTSQSSFFDDYGDVGEIEASCMQYRPTSLGNDKYIFNMSYMLNSTWRTENISVQLNLTALQTPYMIENWGEDKSRELRLDVYDRDAGSALFYYLGYFNKRSHRLCETHVHGEQVVSYENNTSNICTSHAEKICQGGTRKAYTNGCGTSSLK
uniref:Lipocalin n=1 Tax=Rhipicephalus appendiculatus TaxID=34631 RepID=A0A131Z5X4_RHIAP